MTVAIHNHTYDNMVTEQTIISASLPSNFLYRSIKGAWWQLVEEKEVDAEVGKRFLVRRLISTYRGMELIHDYITTKVSEANLYNGWVRQTVVYVGNEPSPYNYDESRLRDPYPENSQSIDVLSSSALYSS